MMSWRHSTVVPRCRDPVAPWHPALAAWGLKAEAEREAARADASAERARAAQAERKREAAKVAAAAAEGEAKGLRLALEEARRPFWRRWLG